MKKIKLSKNQFTIVDNEDFDYINQWKWCFDGRYAVRRDNNKKKTIFMHRIIMKTPQGKQTDHINGNKLDNRKLNMRICTAAQNYKNQKLRITNKSKHKGVSWSKQVNKWRVDITVNYKRIFLGYFYKKVDAIKTSKIAHEKYFGDFNRGEKYL